MNSAHLAVEAMKGTLTMAVASKSSAPASDSIMTPDKMKPILALSKREPVQAAVGLTADGQGVILLHKKLKPKKVLAQLKADAAKAKIQLQPSTLRYGTAEVDTDYDPGMVRFFLNKDSPGNMRMKLVEVVKRIPYQKVELNTQPSLELEEDEDGETQTEDQDVPVIPTEPVFDAAALNKELTALVRRIPELANAPVPVRAALAKLANDANAALKGNELAVASTLITQLREDMRQALDDAGVGVGQVVEQKGTGTVAYAKSRLAWIAVRGKMQSDIGKLQTALIDTYKADGVAADLEARYKRRVAPMLAALDESLADKLDEVTNEADAVKRVGLADEARVIIAKYQAFIANDGLIVELDENPFVPLTLKTTLTSTLATIAAAVR